MDFAHSSISCSPGAGDSEAGASAARSDADLLVNNHDTTHCLELAFLFPEKQQ